MKRSPVQEFVESNETAREQYAALCWRRAKSGIEVLLITSRETGRWVTPKGWPMKGLSAAKTAALEAWQEAGVKGKVSKEMIGLFSYEKVTDRSAKVPPVQPCVVSVFPLEVSQLEPEFPEQRQRRRKWFTPEKAARKVHEPELRNLLANFAP